MTSARVADPPPAAGPLGAPPAPALVTAAISLGVLAVAASATWAEAGARWADLAVAGRPDALPGWWSTVLYALVALSCLQRARDELLRAPSAPRWRTLAGAAAWAGLGGLVTVLSADHVLQLHLLLAGDDRLTALPGPVAAHPVQAALVVAALPVAVLVLLVAPPRERLLVLAAGALHLASGVLLDQRIIQPSWSFTRVETAELALEWAGALLLMAAALTRPPRPVQNSSR